MGVLPVTRPTLRGSGIALNVERATPKPTPVCINDYNSHSPMRTINYLGILHTHERHCCLVLDIQFGTARFLRVKHKASSNAFSIYRSPPLQSHTHAGLRYENSAKISIIFLNTKQITKKNEAEKKYLAYSLHIVQEDGRFPFGRIY